MPIYKPSELRIFLQELGIAPRKGLSQNFLIDGNIVRKIAAAAHVQEGDLVLEIGPGPGALTQILLESQAHVVAVEKDTTLAAALNRENNSHLEVFCEDIMEFSFDDVLKPRLQGRKAKVIANLPYHLTTPILAQLITRRDLFSTLVLMVQKEVAERCTAAPCGKDYGSLTVFLNFYSRPHYAFTVSRHCFYPEPKVDSAVVVFDLCEPPQVDNEERFFALTRTAFHQRRKMLRVSLKGLYSTQAVSEALEAIGKNPLARPEDLSIQDFLSLYKALN